MAEHGTQRQTAGDPGGVTELGLWTVAVGLKMWKHVQMAIESSQDQRLVWSTSRGVGGFRA